jgi:TPR repeat protein
VGIDYYLWKWKALPPTITPGVCCLLLMEGMECPEAAELDIESLEAKVDAVFPERMFVLDFTSWAVLLHTSTSTPIEVAEWFLDLAGRDGMVFFDPQTAVITKADHEELERRAEQWESKQQAARATAELPALEAKAAAGDPKALFDLANLYNFGEGVKRDYNKAFELFELSANAGWSDGMFNLAACYRFGEGVEKDIDKALAWYARAAEKDPAFGFFALGEIYARGETGVLDRDKALHYLQLAWDHGNRGAYKIMRELGVTPK